MNIMGCDVQSNTIYRLSFLMNANFRLLKNPLHIYRSFQYIDTQERENSKKKCLKSTMKPV
jgi:hypothetical protein